MMRRSISVCMMVFAVCLLVLSSPCGSDAAQKDLEARLKRWTHSEEAKDDMGGRFTLTVTPYTAEYINLLIESEAEKNLWTATEMEDYKYNFLKSIQLDDYLAFHVEVENLGATAHMAPFNEMVYLWIGNTKFSPADYDPRFNMPLQGKCDGLVFFPRYDEKTGKPLLDKDTSLRFVLLGAASPVLSTRDIRMTWDIKAEKGIIVGTAADRMEVDRLLRRMEKLNGERSELQTQLDAKDKEITEITQRIEELQGKR